MNIRLIMFSTAAFLFIQSAAACAGEQMTLKQCITKALETHPSLTAAEGTVESDRAKASQEAVNSRLSASVRSGYTRSGSTKGESSGTNDGDWSTGVTLSQLVYDWGKTGTAVKSAKLTTQAAEKTAARTRETVIADVRDAYYALNKAVRDTDVQREQVRNYEQRLEWAKTYYSVGTKAKIEVTTAETDLANARLALIKAESAAEQSKASLASAIGDPTLVIDSVKDELDFVDWNIALADALKRAEANRPDLAAEDLLVKKAEMDVKSAKLTNAPSVNASAGYNFGGTGYYDDDQWTAGLELSVPVGDGGETKAKIAQTKADLKVAAANREKLAQDIVLDVRTAWESLRESAASIVAARAAEKQAKENLDLALGRYRAGVGTSLEISDAVDSYATARSTVIASLYDHKEARLNLEKAMGEVSEL
jgi:outer membrane protein